MKCQVFHILCIKVELCVYAENNFRYEMNSEKVREGLHLILNKREIIVIQALTCYQHLKVLLQCASVTNMCIFFAMC